MANVTFTEFVTALSELTSPALTDYWPIIDDEATDATKKVTLSAVKALFGLDLSELTEKTTPVDDDLFIIYDSAASNAPKKIKAENMPGGGSSSREVLTADRTYYVRTDGSNSNDGLSNTSGGAFLTIQKAVDVAAALDVGIYDVTIQIGDGTYISDDIELKNPVGSGKVTIQGNSSTPSNVVVDGGFVKNTPGTIYQIFDLKLVASSAASNTAIESGYGANIEFENIEFSTGYTRHIAAIFSGFIEATGDYSISGSATYHWLANGGVIVAKAITITLTGTLAFSSFALSTRLGKIEVDGSNTYTGSATGKRYTVEVNAVIYSQSTLPGDTAGTTATGGQYG